MKPLSVIFLAAVLWAGGASAQNQTNINPRADNVLRAASQYLAESPFFGIRAEIWREHLMDSGQKVQFSRTVNMEVKRPDRLHVEIQSPGAQRGFWYDGKSLAILDRIHNVFSITPMTGALDGVLDKAHDQFGIDLPLMDLAVTDPYKNATAKVVKGTYYGLAPVLGYQCHHLAFTQDNIDWQVWIQDGPQPLIRKFVITHKNEDGAPEFTALITQWDLTDRISDSVFVFQPPPGASKIEMRQQELTFGTGNRSASLPRSNP